MEVNVHRLVLDTDKSCKTRTVQHVKVRQGDKAADVIEAQINSDMGPDEMAGLTARVMACLANGTVASADCAFVSGKPRTVRAELDSSFSSSVGKAKSAYVELRRGEEVVASTEGFSFEVVRGVDVTAEEAQPYVSVLDQVTKRAEQLSAQMQQTIDEAEISMEAERLDPGAQPTVSEQGSGLKKTFTLGLPSATAGVSCEQGPSDVVTVSGAAEDAPIPEVVVFGETRQNLALNPVGSGGGISSVENNDGSLTISGTATSEAAIHSKKIYFLGKGKKYTISSSDFLSASSEYAVFVIYFYEGGDPKSYKTFASSHTGFGEHELSVTFDVPDYLSYAEIGVYVGANVEVRGSYRIMLNEGDSPAPWCPPGLTSVDDVESRSFKNNMLVGSDTFDSSEFSRTDKWTEETEKHNGCKVLSNTTKWGGVYGNFLIREGTKFTFSAYAKVDAGYAGSVFFVSGAHGILTDQVNSEVAVGENWTKISKTYTMKVSGNPVVRIEKNTSSPEKLYISQYQIELGENVSPYDSLANAVSIPLPPEHPYLASLPDGTRDELRMRWDGTAELVARVGKRVLDGSEDWALETTGMRAFAKEDSLERRTEYKSSMSCDTLSVEKAHDSIDGMPSVSGLRIRGELYPGENWLYAWTPGATDAASVKAWFAANPTTVLFKLANEKFLYFDGERWGESKPEAGSLAPLRSVGDPTRVLANASPVPAKVSADVLLKDGEKVGELAERLFGLVRKSQTP